MSEPSLWSFIINAGFIVKLVMIILFCASIASWTIIIQRSWLFKTCRQLAERFERKFWSGIELNQLFNNVKDNANRKGMANIFYAGFSEYSRLREQSHPSPGAVMDGTQRAMRIAQAKEIKSLEQHLSILATIGSTSPYVGLFGTVWGIMTAFRALGAVQQATISMVAPGIAEALIATAIGLFAAIPAVVAYNRFANDLERMQQQYDTFQEELTNILHREAYATH